MVWARLPPSFDPHGNAEHRRLIDRAWFVLATEHQVARACGGHASPLPSLSASPPPTSPSHSESQPESHALSEDQVSLPSGHERSAAFGETDFTSANFDEGDVGTDASDAGWRCTTFSTTRRS